MRAAALLAVLLAAAACADPIPPREERLPVVPPPAATPQAMGPADQATLCHEIADAQRRVEAAVSEFYRPESSLLRRLFGGGEAPAQLQKQETVKRTLQEKELRLLGGRRGVSYEHLQQMARPGGACAGPS